MSDVISRMAAEVMAAVDGYKHFEGSRKDFLIGVWGLRNKARRICRKLESTELLDAVLGLLTPEDQELLDVFDTIYDDGYADGAS